MRHSLNGIKNILDPNILFVASHFHNYKPIATKGAWNRHVARDGLIVRVVGACRKKRCGPCMQTAHIGTLLLSKKHTSERLVIVVKFSRQFNRGRNQMRRKQIFFGSV